MGSCKKALNVTYLSVLLSVSVCLYLCLTHFYLKFPRFKSFTCHFITYYFHQFLRYLAYLKIHKKMGDSKSGSKSDLNESNMPLLDDDQTEKAGETPEKEQIEMTEEVAEEKDDSKDTEK